MTSESKDRQLADLNALLDISRELGATSELVPLLQKVERGVRQVLDCDRGSVFLYDRLADELYSLVATGEETIRFSAGLGIAGEALRARAMVNVPDAYADARFNRAIDKETGYRTRNLLTFPLIGHDESVVGVLQALNKRDGAFTASDEYRAADFGALAGVAVQRQMLLNEYEEKKRLDHDLSIARDIQQNLLPECDPQLAGYSISGWNEPADQTGGDCYDFIASPNGKLGILLADVTGHGIGPALVAAECRALFRALVSSDPDIVGVTARMNELLHADLSDGRFVTAFVGVLDSTEHRLSYVAPGQGPLLHYSAQDRSFQRLAASTVPLGIVPDLPSGDPCSIAFAPGDVFVLLTDGFLEWADPDGAQFGVERAEAVIDSHQGDSPKSIIECLHAAVTGFARGVAQADDLTAIIVKRDA